MSQRQGSQDGPRADHVDRVQEQWRVVLPELDTSPVGVISRIGRAREYIDDGLNQLLGAHGLNRSLWDVLAGLRREGPPYRLSPTELYRGLMRTSGAITHRLGTLERAGLIERVPDPADGRSLLVALTPRGKELVDEIAPAYLENERRLLAGLSPDEQASLAELLRKLLLGFEDQAPVPPRGRRRRRG
jgi:DNA-binding MarR family transcriptional regulator